jgi:periplasmic protein TonB
VHSPGRFNGVLKANVRYPADAAKAGIGGKVIVGFVVTKKGKVKHVEIVQGVHPSIDAEALRVVKAMPAMSPGRLQGKPIDCNMNLPINFNPS